MSELARDTGRAVDTERDEAAPSTDTTISDSPTSDTTTIAEEFRQDPDLVERVEDLERQVVDANTTIRALQVSERIEDGVKYIKDRIDEWGTSDQQVLDYLKNNFADFTAAEKDQFLKAFEAETGETLRDYLNYDIEANDIAQGLLDFYGPGPDAINQRAAIIAGRMDVASRAEQVRLLTGRSPEELQAIRDAYAESHDGRTLQEKFRLEQMSPSDHIEIARLIDGTDLAQGAATIYNYAIGSRDDIHRIRGILTNISSPEEFAALDAKFREMYPQSGLGIRDFLVRNLDNRGQVEFIIGDIDEDILGAVEEAPAVVEADPAVTTEDEPAAEVEAAPPVTEVPLPTPDIEAAPETEPEIIPETEPDPSPSVEAPAEEIVIAESRNYLHLSSVIETSTDPVIQIFNRYNQARMSGDPQAIADVQAEIEGLDAATKQAYLAKIKNWKPETKPTGVEYTADEWESIVSRRREIQFDFASAFADPSSFFAGGDISVSVGGIDAETHRDRMASLTLAA